MKLIRRYEKSRWNSPAADALKLCLCIAVFFCVVAAHAQLSVIVSPIKVSGQKVIVPLMMINNFTEKIESARAVVFLMDDQGKMVGQKTGWVIGGTKDRPALESEKDTTYNFVLTAVAPLTTTNLTTRVAISQLILAGGQIVDVNKNVKIQKAEQSK